MSETINPRITEIKSRLPQNSFTETDDATVVELINLEDRMSDNKISLISLMNEEILEKTEVLEKIEICFQVFLKKAVKILGPEKCKAIYDFLPGENLTFLESKKVEVPSALAVNLGKKLKDLEIISSYDIPNNPLVVKGVRIGRPPEANLKRSTIYDSGSRDKYKTLLEKIRHEMVENNFLNSPTGVITAGDIQPHFYTVHNSFPKPQFSENVTAIFKELDSIEKRIPKENKPRRNRHGFKKPNF
ncbi:hypothetical protein ACO0LF_14410 [Undibacterium sp. Di27W]|uniref:hypothetical protein n=1 Tax=Undibacterium sp. Di27W TaxID=3413036 RepID=UPI003BF2965B